MATQEPFFLTPAEIAEATVGAGVKKSRTPLVNLLILSFLAGAYIAFAGAGSNMAAFNLLGDPATYGLGRALAGSLFTVGLMMVVVAGGELFTGNILILASVLERRSTVSGMLRNWAAVYLGNFAGSLLVAFMIAQSGLLGNGGNALAAVTIKVAVSKCALSFWKAFLLGILCNWLVCIAVWMAAAAKDITGKLLAVFFPIWLFVTSGFEHSVANMFYIPAGIFAKGVGAYADAALATGLTQAQLDGLNWGAMMTNNLLPVTLGNIIGGGVFVALAYWVVYLRKGGEP